MDLEPTLQTLTDAATQLAGAKFGAFFLYAPESKDQKYCLHTLSGLPRERVADLSLAGAPVMFELMFENASSSRSIDIGSDPRYGLNEPHSSAPGRQLEIASTLAVPVMSRLGEVYGGLFLGHEQPGLFTEDTEEIISAIAAHASIAIEKAKLMKTAQNEIEQRRQAQEAVALLASIVTSSEDAILSKSLKGIITSWNGSAERLFGYSAAEAKGQSIMMIIPEDRRDEEASIIERIRRGERVDHYETVRRRKDGSLLDISITVSPILNAEGTVIGASKIARDITDRKRGQEQQFLLLREMNHRVKNLFALATGLVSLSARSAETPQALAAAIRERLNALARAHELTLPNLHMDEDDGNKATTLMALLSTILAPFQSPERERVFINGSDVAIGEGSLTSLALLLHEFATNSAKYGALSTPQGRLTISLATQNEQLQITWVESEGPPLNEAIGAEGFGSRLARATVQGHLQGTIDRDWKKEGLVIKLSVPLERLSA